MTEIIHAASAPQAEASVWLARLHADDRTLQDERAFRRWITADPAHERAFAQLTAAWDLAGGSPRAPYAETGEHDAPSRFSRRRLMSGSLAAAAIAGGFGYWQTALAGVYETAPGQQKTVTLNDGTHLFLDTDTRVRARYTHVARAIELVHGRCNLRIAGDGIRPFEIDVSARKVIADQGNIDILNYDNRVQVLCVTGSVTVTGGAGGTGRLAAGDRYVAVASGAGQIDKPDLESELAWQTGQLVFDDQSLAEAITDMNRYSRTKLVVGDQRAASLRISGTFEVGDNTRFALSVSKVVPVAVSVQDGTIVLTAREAP